MEPERPVYCPRCREDQSGKPLHERYTDLGEGKDKFRSYFKYKCDNCGCTFLVKDDYLSPGDWAERNIVRDMLREGKNPAAIAKELGKPLSWVTDIIEWMKEDDPRVPI
jgi:transposase-like protein